MLHFVSSGHVFSGLRVHPDREHIIYPLGSTVILKRIKDGKQEFLHGHTNNVSCISVSKSGSYIASGQVNFMGFKVAIVMTHFPYLKFLIWLSPLNHKITSLICFPFWCCMVHKETVLEICGLESIYSVEWQNKCIIYVSLVTILINVYTYFPRL